MAERTRALGKWSAVVDGPAGHEVRISVPFEGLARFIWAVFICSWILVSAVVAVLFAISAATGSGPTVASSLAFWLVWALIGALIGAWSMWLTRGVEIVAVRQGLFILKRQFLCWESRFACSLAECRQLRTVADCGVPLSRTDMIRSAGLTGGAIVLDYGTKSMRFGVGLDEKEAQAIVSELQHDWRPNT